MHNVVIFNFNNENLLNKKVMQYYSILFLKRNYYLAVKINNKQKKNI
jgi:hypothetical protein